MQDPGRRGIGLTLGYGYASLAHSGESVVVSTFERLPSNRDDRGFEIQLSMNHAIEWG